MATLDRSSSNSRHRRADVPVDPHRFVEQLDRLLDAVPNEFEFAVELRSRALLTPEYRRVLARHRRRARVQLLELHAHAWRTGDDRSAW